MKNLIEQLALSFDTYRIAASRDQDLIADAAYKHLTALCQQIDGASECFLSTGSVPPMPVTMHEERFALLGTDFERSTRNGARFVIICEEGLDTDAGEFTLVDLRDRVVVGYKIETRREWSATLEEWIEEIEA